MSSTTTSTTPAKVNVGSSFGALSYNINSMLGWRLGNPTTNEILLYSDLVEANAGSFYVLYDFENGSPSNYLFKQYDASYSDQTLVNAASGDMTGSNDLVVTSLSASAYSTMFASSDGLMGMTWLPWSPYGLVATDGSGNYNVKQYANTSSTDITSFITCNPMRKEVLYIKMFTILKLFGIGFGIFALIKLIIHFADKK